MNTHDRIELPPLPQGYCANEIRQNYARQIYLENHVKAYARAAIEPYVKRIAELEAARIAYASEFAPDEDGNPDVGSIHENIRKLKADLKDSERNDSGKGNENDHRKRRGEPVSTHNVHRGAESLPCYCPGELDHPIGKETQPTDPVKIDVDELAQEIRRVDGNNALGAGALADALMPFLESALQSQERAAMVPYEVVVNVANKLLGAEQYERFMGELDHARRILAIQNGVLI